MPYGVPSVGVNQRFTKEDTMKEIVFVLSPAILSAIIACIALFDTNWLKAARFWRRLAWLINGLSNLGALVAAYMGFAVFSFEWLAVVAVWMFLGSTLRDWALDRYEDLRVKSFAKQQKVK